MTTCRRTSYRLFVATLALAAWGLGVQAQTATNDPTLGTTSTTVTTTSVTSTTASTSAWDLLDEAGLLKVAQAINASTAQGQTDRQALAAYVAGRYSEKASLGLVDWRLWCPLIANLGPAFPATAQQTMAGDLESTVPADAATVAKLGLPSVLSTAGALTALGHTSSARNLAITWTSSYATLDRVGSGGLASLADALVPTGDAGAAARTRVASVVETVYLSSPDVIQTVALKTWGILTKDLQGTLSDTQKQAWAAKLKAAYTGSSGIWVLKSDGLRALSQALVPLGDASAPTLLTDFVQQTTAWQAWTPVDLAELAQVLRGMGDQAAAKTARATLSGYLQTTYSADVSKLKSAGVPVLKVWVQSLAGEWADTAKAAWRAGIRAAYVQDASTLGQMPDVRPLCQVLGSLGDSASPQVVAQWINVSIAWQSWRTDNLVSLAMTLKKIPLDGHSARLTLGTYIVAQGLKDDTQVARVPLMSWLYLVRAVGDDLPQEARDQWAKRLQEVMAQGSKLAGLSPDSTRNLTEVIRILQGAEAATPAADWFANKAAWDQASPRTLGYLAVWAGQAGRPLSATVMADLDARWTQAYSQGALDFAQVSNAAVAWWYSGDKAKAQAWAMKAYQQALGTDQAKAAVTAGTFWELGGLIYWFAMGGPDKDYPDYAAALAGYLAQDKPIPAKAFMPKFWAAPVIKPENRAVVEAQLVDATGHPRPAVARVLAFAYQAGGQLDAFRGLVDQKLADTSADADTKALWLVARAAAEMAQDGTGSVSQAKPYLDKAWSTASSDGVRLAVLQELVGLQTRAGQFRQAGALLQSVAGQFTDPASQTQLATISQGLVDAQREHDRQVLRDVANSAVSQANAQRAELTRRLALAKDQGDQEAVQRLQQILSHLP